MYLAGVLGGLNNRGVTGFRHANGVLAQRTASKMGAQSRDLKEVCWRSAQGQPHVQGSQHSGPDHALNAP